MHTIENEKELFAICGGISLTSSFLNAISNVCKTIYEIGRSLGSAIRRTKDGKTCPI